MFRHEKQLFRTVGVEKINPHYGDLLTEQLGGANGELKSAMQYISQSFKINDRQIKDMLLDIAAEELGHMEMLAQTVRLLYGYDENKAADSINSRGQALYMLNNGLLNASGRSWTADYLNVTGDVRADILSDIASEQRSKVVYEYLYRLIEDKKVRETIDFLISREEAHSAMFRKALKRTEEIGIKRDIGAITSAKMYFNMSSVGRGI